MKQLALYLAIAGLAAACASDEKKTETPVTERSAGGSTSRPGDARAGAGSTTRPQETTGITGDPRDPGSILAKRSVFFDYDSNVVKDEYRGLVQAHSRYMTDKRDSRVRIEGNADERGSR